ncbi:MAG TPA: di-heme oxidoredictase family protein [Bryobacteraceae bacterium]|jgi:CxxC motif-containing protein (DUF1111 family)|nr:di-heme oxidoredictase family protein [Bryobacteraceae bacterium]
MQFSKLYKVVAAIICFAVISLADGPRAADGGSNHESKDPGVRQGAAGAGSALSGLDGNITALFNQGSLTFSEVDSVTGTMPGESDAGLGPSFNMNSCTGCHSYPAPGGSSPPLNPQVAVAVLHGARNTLPSFIKSDGPVREARFKRNADGSPDGGVHDLFVITGRSDAPAGCNFAQTDFASQVSSGNVSYRIPTPTFGAGLIESISDATILANKAANASIKSSLGISGRENRSGNDGTITRFGWKAQNKSLLMFAGEAYAVEQGVTNELFPNSRQDSASCGTNASPEDRTDPVTGASSDIVNFAMFMRLLAPPQPVTSYAGASASSIQNGHVQFVQAGCGLCHTESLTTSNSAVGALSNQAAHLFSDLLVHDMGSDLADGISQGAAGPGEFRTAPLWGLGQRIFFLHDGRTSDLVDAIQNHSSSGSEANGSIKAFNALNNPNTQDLLNFLRSL